MRAAAAAPLATLERDVARAERAAGGEDALGHRRHRVELGVALDDPALGAAGDAEPAGDLVGVGLRLQADRQDDHVDRDPALPAGQGVLDLDDEPAVLGRLLGQAQDVGHLGDPAADEDRALVLDALVELVERLAGRPDVDVELVDARVGVLAHEVGELHALHAADRRAVGVEVAVAAADAVDDRDAAAARSRRRAARSDRRSARSRCSSARTRGW